MSNVLEETTCASKFAPPQDLRYHFSNATNRRVPSSVKLYYKYFTVPGIGNLAGGLPNAQYFPFDTLEAQTATATRWQTSSQDAAVPSQQQQQQHITVPRQALPPKDKDPKQRIDVNSALQYGTSQGYPALLNWTRQFTREHLHPRVPYAGGPEVIMTCGSTDGFAKTIELLVDNVEATPGAPREPLLCERFMYPNVLAQIAPKGMLPIPVAMDAQGMRASGPDGLGDVLKRLTKNPMVDGVAVKRPRILYTVTMGQNPTGGLLGMERRREIYALCEMYDVIIIEDDPYWYLQYPSAAPEEAKCRGLPVAPSNDTNTDEHYDQKSRPSSGFPFLDSLVPSYLSIDVSGRVIRLDTFSKTIAPGCRLGWITAQPTFIEKFARIAETSTQEPSGFVQAMVASLIMGSEQASFAGSSSPSPFSRIFSLPGSKPTIPSGWGAAGWVRWLEGLRNEYERRMVRMCLVLERGSTLVHPDGRRHIMAACPSANAEPHERDWQIVSTQRLLQFDWPRGGMFVWVRVFFEQHPLFGAHRSEEKAVYFRGLRRLRVLVDNVVGGADLNAAMLHFLTRKPYFVIVSPGTMFSANDDVRQEHGWKFIRLCFAAESDDRIEMCTQKLVDGLHKFWQITDIKELEKLLDEIKQNQHAAAPAAPNMEENVAGLAQLGWAGC